MRRTMRNFERDVQDMLLVAVSGGTMTWIANDEQYAKLVYDEVQRRLLLTARIDGEV